MRDALIGYSVSLANESYDNEALAQLEKWIHGYTNGEGVSHGVQPTSVSMLNQSYIDASHFARVSVDVQDKSTNRCCRWKRVSSTLLDNKPMASIPSFKMPLESSTT